MLLRDFRFSMILCDILGYFKQIDIVILWDHMMNLITI